MGPEQQQQQQKNIVQVPCGGCGADIPVEMVAGYCVECPNPKCSRRACINEINHELVLSWQAKSK